jgi:hypothetical protein
MHKKEDSPQRHRDTEGGGAKRAKKDDSPQRYGETEEGGANRLWKEDSPQRHGDTEKRESKNEPLNAFV